VTGVLLLLFAVVAGSFLPVQAAVNARLTHYVGGPVRASMISFFVGAVVLLIVALLFTRGGAKPSDAPWRAWVGGALGAFYVTSTVVVPVRIGAAAFFGILVAAQLVTSVLADQFGWLGFEQKDISPLRAAGVALLIGGALLVRIF
jgi:bacterial/archaeal transporter family-2 protein